MRISDSVRRKIYDRDGGHCVSCGTTEGLSIQHRRNKQMGGSKRLDGASNLLTMCLLENQALESDARAAEYAKSRGWKLLSWQDPKKFPVWDEVSQAMFWLLDDWTRVRAVGA